ncbi:MAG: hypothetical protein IIB63_03820, partial [Proteobacteria bacterium]|nr:hypothetical protein [Pseudomonadota bacterium]
SQAETYLVNIGLPNSVLFYGVRVTKGTLSSGANLLIGMNIITKGDFAVSNFNGVTKFTFRVPSTGHIDFVAAGNRPRFQHGGALKPNRAGQAKRAKASGKRKRNRSTKKK